MIAILYQAVFRPTADISGLPFGVRSAGHYKCRSPFISSDKKIKHVQLFWGVRGSGIIEFNNRKRVLKRHQVALYYPGMRHYYYADRQDWEFYWFTLDGPFAVSLPAAFGLEPGIYDAGQAPEALFKSLLVQVCQISKSARLRACMDALAILGRAAGAPAEQTDEMVNAAIERIHEQFASPALNIKTLAGLLHIRRNAFSARFHTAMGITPGIYLKRLRIQKGLALLQHTHLPIAAIATQCGYTDAEYFSQVIRRATGRPPLQFRKNNQDRKG